MHRLYLEELYDHRGTESAREKNLGIDAILSETGHPEAKGEAPRPTNELALSYYYEKNPFLTEISSTMPSGMIVVPVLLKVDYGFTGLISGRAILQHSLRAAVKETMLDAGELGRLIQLEDGNWLVLFQRDLRGDTPHILIEDTEMDWAALKGRCENLKERFRIFWRCGLACFIGEPVPCRDLALEFEILWAKSRESKSEAIQFIYEDCDGPQKFDTRPDFEVWALMLRGRDGHALVKEAARFLIPHGRAPRSDSVFLHGFQQDFLQMVYSVLKERNIQAHELFNNGHAVELWDRACLSIDDLVAWISYIVLEVCEQLGSESLGRSVVHRVRAFVAANLENDLSRKSIAAHVGLNPDYLARIFKREKGLSIWEFVQNERMAVARDLLARTDIPICTVALEVGYRNFSHFAEAFRNFAGRNPADFRKGSPDPRTPAKSDRSASKVRILVAVPPRKSNVKAPPLAASTLGTR
jgi:two-component system response regulator YesN